MNILTGKAFTNLNHRRQTPTLIAYCIALVSRVFDHASQRSASCLLKLLKIFGYSLISVGQPQGLTLEQENALKDIPDTIETLENQLNLGIMPKTFAVCPKCSYTYE